MKTERDFGREFLEAIARGCGFDLGKVAEININFKAPKTVAEVTVTMFAVDFQEAAEAAARTMPRSEGDDR